MNGCGHNFSSHNIHIENFRKKKQLLKYSSLSQRISTRYYSYDISLEGAMARYKQLTSQSKQISYGYE